MRNFIFTLVAAFMMVSPLTAQDLETGYFLGGNPFAFRLNPAFQSERNIVSIGLGMTGAGTWGNLGASTLLYPDGNNLYSFLNNHVAASDFLGKLHRNNYLDVDAQVNLLTVGFWSDRDFLTIDVNARTLNAVTLPYDFFRLLKGDKAVGSVFECGSTGFRSFTFAEAAFGWSRIFDNRFSVGARAKFIVGAGEMEMMLKKMQVTINEDSWTIRSHGQMVSSSPAVTFDHYADSDLLDLGSFRLDGDNISPSGWGGALDLGVSWNVTPLLTLSGAILDLGAICWERDSLYETPEDAYDWAPSEMSMDVYGYTDGMEELLEMVSGFFNWREVTGMGTAFELMPIRINVGAEYRIPFYDRLSVGALYEGRFVNCFARHTGRLSLNWNPLDFLSMSTSAALNGFGESLGFALNLHPPGVNLILGCDCLPFHVVDVSPLFEDLIPRQARWTVIPRDRMNMNLYVGINVAFGRSRLDHTKHYLLE